MPEDRQNNSDKKNAELYSLIQLIGERLFATIRSTLPLEDKQDILNDVYLKILSRSGPVNFISDLSKKSTRGYIYAIIKNALNDYYRHRQREQEVLKGYKQVQEYQFPEKDIETSRIHSIALMTELNLLPKEDRALLIMRFWQGKSIHELAAIKKSSYGAMAVRMFRLFRKLRERLEIHGDL